jgi:hypothetical protein
MAQFEILLISILRTLVEVAGMALIGQGLLAVLAGAKRNDNFVYRLFQVVTAPVIRMVRLITPRFVIDRHLPFLTFFLLFWLWLALAFLKRYLCTLHGLSCQ